MRKFWNALPDRAGYLVTFISSTLKMSVAPGWITGGDPVSPYANSGGHINVAFVPSSFITRIDDNY